MSETYDLKDEALSRTTWDTETILPEGFLPMLATAAAGPLDSSEYGYEVKWEGLRVLAGLEGPDLILRTGTGQPVQQWFPELRDARAAAQPEWVLLDGELLVIQDGRSSLPLLQQRLRAPDLATVEALAAETPVRLVVFDVLRIGDSWLLDVTWEERRDILTRVVTATKNVRVSPAFATGQAALTQAKEVGLEAVVAKRLRGRYYPGERTRDWLNIKPREVVEAVICGWTEGRGARGGSIGTLLLGMYRDNELIYIGHTGTGLDAETLRTLHQELVRRGQYRCPFVDEPSAPGDPRWVRPELVCRIRHQGWSETGKMRSPTFLELAGELAPGECRLPARGLSGASR
jgi:bifunctional non-homologous end joining protein LigD